MSEDVLLQRIEALEARLAALESGDSQESVSHADRHEKFTSLVLRCTPRALGILFRELPSNELENIFYMEPRPILLKLRESVSARTWRGLVATWREGTGGSNKSSCEQDLVRVFDQFMAMGMIGSADDSGPIDEQHGTRLPPHSEAYWEQARIDNRQQRERVKEAARVWLDREIPESADLAKS